MATEGTVSFYPNDVAKICVSSHMRYIWDTINYFTTRVHRALPVIPSHLTRCLIEIELDFDSGKEFPLFETTSIFSVLPHSLIVCIIHFPRLQIKNLGVTAGRVRSGDFHEKAILAAWPTHRSSYPFKTGLLIFRFEDMAGGGIDLSTERNPGLWDRAETCLRERNEWEAKYMGLKFNLLPYELRSEILEWIAISYPQPDLLSFMRVCKMWKYFIAAIIYRCVTLTSMPQSGKFIRAINHLDLSLGSYVHHLKINLVAPPPGQPFQNCSNLISFCTDVCSTPRLPTSLRRVRTPVVPRTTIATQLKSITHLHLQIPFNTENLEEMDLAPLCNLTHLFLEQIHVNPVPVYILSLPAFRHWSNAFANTSLVVCVICFSTDPSTFIESLARVIYSGDLHPKAVLLRRDHGMPLQVGVMELIRTPLVMDVPAMDDDFWSSAEKCLIQRQGRKKGRKIIHGTG